MAAQRLIVTTQRPHGGAETARGKWLDTNDGKEINNNNNKDTLSGKNANKEMLLVKAVKTLGI